MATAAKNVKQEKPAKTTYDSGKELENRVARMLKKRGHICIKQNQRVKKLPTVHCSTCRENHQPLTVIITGTLGANGGMVTEVVLPLTSSASGGVKEAVMWES